MEHSYSHSVLLTVLLPSSRDDIRSRLLPAPLQGRRHLIAALRIDGRVEGLKSLILSAVFV